MKLKPCPFCGGEANLNVYSNNGKPTDWSIRCKVGECSASIYGLEGEENITTRWNRRMNEPPTDNCLDVRNHDIPGDIYISFVGKVRRFLQGEPYE